MPDEDKNMMVTRSVIKIRNWRKMSNYLQKKKEERIEKQQCGTNCTVHIKRQNEKDYDSWIGWNSQESHLYFHQRITVSETIS